MIVVPTHETGPATRLSPERRKTCSFCKNRLIGKQATCCAKPECRKALKARNDRRHWQRKFGKAPKKTRQCKDCLAWDSETKFVGPAQCQACGKREERYGRCERCKGLLTSVADHGDHWDEGAACFACDQPTHAIEVLWMSTDGRTRRIYRTIRRGRVSIAAQEYLVMSNPFTLKVEPEAWVSTRA